MAEQGLREARMEEVQCTLAALAFVQAVARVALDQVRTALPVALVAEVALALEPCPTWAPAVENTCKKLIIGTWDTEVTSIRSAPGEILLASSRDAAC